MLSDVGWPQQDVRLVIVRDTRQGACHMVTAVRDAGRWLILDNRSDDLAENGALKQLRPVFSLDRRGVLQIGPPSPPGRFRPDAERRCVVSPPSG